MRKGCKYNIPAYLGHIWYWLNSVYQIVIKKGKILRVLKIFFMRLLFSNIFLKELSKSFIKKYKVALNNKENHYANERNFLNTKVIRGDFRNES